MTHQDRAPTKRAHCPHCGTESAWQGNPHRPFCSLTCRLLDLGVWLAEQAPDLRGTVATERLFDPAPDEGHRGKNPAWDDVVVVKPNDPSWQPRRYVPLITRYFEEGNPPDAPGNFVAWLYTRGPVYGYRFSGEWHDIGDLGQLLEADNLLRERAGLPTRAEYSPD